MTKGLKYGALSLVASALLSTSVFAGTVNTTPYTIADEYINGQASAALSVGTKIFTAYNGTDAITTNDNGIAGYSPTTIPAISLANGTVVLSASSGSLSATTVSGTKLVLMEDNGPENTDVVIGVYANAYGGKLSFASDASVSYTNGKSYRLATVLSSNAVAGTRLDDNISTAAVAGDLTLSAVAQNTATVDFKVELFSTDTQTLRDTGTSALVTTPVQVTATTKKALNGVIDAINKAQKEFTAGDDSVTTDVLTITVAAADYDVDAVANGDTTKIVVSNTKALPVGMTVVPTVANGAVVPTCTIAADRLSTTCTTATSNIAPGTSEVFTLTYTQTGLAETENPIADATFSAVVTYDFVTALMVDYTTNLLASPAVGAWTYNGYNAKIPYISNDGAGTSTFVKLVNKNALTAAVTANIQDDAGHLCNGIQLAALPANQAAVYFDTAITTAAHATAGAGCALVAYPYSVDMFATVNPANIETVAVQKFGNGGQRVLPVYTNRNNTGTLVDGK